MLNEYTSSGLHNLEDPRKVQIGGDHYKNLSVEPWSAMESWLTPREYIGYLRGNIIKYQARARSGKGDFNEHMNKAHHYSQELQRFLATLNLNQSSTI